MDIEVDHEFWTSLKGKTELKDDTKVVDKCKVAEARSLPITTIISRIQAEDSGSDSDYETADGGHHPPPSHTGGKWKPANISFDDSNISPRKSPSLDVLPSSHLTSLQSNGTGASDQFCDVCSLRFTKVENLVIHLTSKKHRSNITLENKHLAAQLYTRHHSDLLKRAAFSAAAVHLLP
ncbi:hypothetical protein EB796_021889 [Bugula neritina]|uniref:C2H2-type domain-containing protein n=1 Tax=Bugula neritina TaxID=10212 RepID=A0A7J7J0T8_BUGNE|nr:hypothetical protein EB796_021889 [Bugula neritina]